jgi:hypothetical protein
MDETLLNKHRLSDRILYALKLAVEQEDTKIADALVSALEFAMTRNTGGGEFVERRDYPEDFERALARLKEIKKKQSQ